MCYTYVMKNKDINFYLGKDRFNFRVACLITHKGRMLLQTNPFVDFWNMSGGRVKLGESTLDALKREMREELGLKISGFIPLIRVAENFFRWEGKKVHELVFIYHIELRDNEKITTLQDFSNLEKEEEKYHWFNFDEVSKINCKPRLIYGYAKHISRRFKHTVLYELNKDYGKKK